MNDSVVDRDARVGELLDAYLEAAHEGRPMVREEFLAAHPEVEAELRAALVGFDFVRGADGELTGRDAAGDEGLPTGTLGDFRLVREVGRGGMAVVYEADQVSLGRKVALKVLPFASVLDDRQLRRFKQEAQSAALLHHTNIVPIYSVGTERGVHYYAMQFIDGRTLAEVIGELRSAASKRRSSKKASSAEALALTPQGTTETPDYCRAVARLGVQAAEALDHAHGNGVVHRDVKPANLLLDAAGHVWVADFGLAQSRTTGNLTMTGAIVGTLRYMSPEQALAKRVPIDHRTDIYSLGVTLYEALTLRPAFPGDDAPAVLQDIAFREPERAQSLNPAVRGALETILLKSMSKDPETRYATAQEMADDLRRYLDDKPVLARRPPLLDRATLWARRHRAVVGAAAAVLVVATAALATSTLLIAAEKRETERHLEDSKQHLAESRKHLEDSKRSAARAEANFGKALEAVDRMLTRVGTQDLVGIPGFEPVRRRLLEEALLFFQEFLDESGADPRLRLETARAFIRVARIELALCDLEAAREASGRARNLLADLAPSDGPWTPILDDVAAAEILHAHILWQAGPEGVIPAYERAVALALRNVKEKPDEVRFAVRLGDAGIVLGRYLQLCNLKDRARVAQEATLRRQEELLARWPGEAALQEGLAEIHADMGSLFSEAGLLAAAEKSYRLSLAGCASGETGPADGEMADNWARANSGLGGTLLGLGRVDEAEPVLRAALKARRRQAADFPRFPRPAIQAAGCAGTLSGVLRQLGRREEAAELDKEALARYESLLAEFEGVSELRGKISESLGRYSRTLWVSGRGRDSVAALQRAVALDRIDCAEFPNDPLRKLFLVMHLRDLVGGMLDSGRGEDAAQAGRDLDAAMKECSSSPGTVDGRPVIAGAIGAVMAAEPEEDQDQVEFEKAMRRSLSLYGELAAECPWAPVYRFDLGFELINLASNMEESQADEIRVLMEESVRHLESAVADAPENPGFARFLALALAKSASHEGNAGRVGNAESLLRRAIEVYQPVVARHSRRLGRVQLASAFVELGLILKKEGRVAEEEGLHLRVIELGRESIRSNEASTENEDEIRMRQLMCRAALALGILRAEARRGAEAMEVLREGAAWIDALSDAIGRPDHLGLRVDLHRQIQLLLVGAGDLDGAERDATETVASCRGWAAKDPAAYAAVLAGALLELSHVCRERGKWKESRDALEESLGLEPRNWKAVCSLAFVLCNGPDPALRDTARGVELVRRALTTLDEPAKGWYLLGPTLLADAQWEESLEAFAKAEELGAPLNGTDRLCQALAHARLGEIDLARPLYDQALSWLRENPAASRELPHLVARQAEIEGLLGIPKGQ